MASLIKPFTQTFHHSSVPSLAARHFLLTGGTNGIGLSISRTLYSRGAHLHLISLDKDIAKEAEAYIRTGDLEKAPTEYREGFGLQGKLLGSDDSGAGGQEQGEVEWTQCDFEDLSALSKVAQNLAGSLERLDGVFFLAGKGVNEFKLTKDGYDSHLTLNNLSHHLLMSHLLPKLISTSKLPGADVRIIQMASELHRATFGGPGPKYGGRKFADEEEFKEDAGQNGLYARTKLGVILFTKALVQRHLPRPSSPSTTPPVLAFATHPGAVATGQQSQFKPAFGEIPGAIMAAAVRPFMSRPDQGAISALWAGTSPQLREVGKWVNGSYFTEAEEEGKESAEGSDQEMIDNFYLNSEKIIQKVTGGGLGPWVDEKAEGAAQA